MYAGLNRFKKGDKVAVFGLKTGSTNTNAAGTNLGSCATEVILAGSADLLLGLTAATGLGLAALF